MKFFELWRLSAVIYKEVSFQSIFSLRTGAILQQKNSQNITRLVNNAKVNALISKILTTVFIGFFAVMVFYSRPTDLPLELTIAGSVSAFLAAILSLITLMGLQVATSFVSSKTTDTLSPLPLSRQDISTIVFLCFIRIFDMPLFVAITALPVLCSYLTGSILGGVACFLGVGVTEVFALALTVSLARFFYSRIVGAGGKSKWKTFLRFVLMLVWVLPTFGAYFVINFATQTVQFFASLTQVFGSASYLLMLVYPFSYGYLISLVSFSYGVSFSSVALSIASSLAYLGLAVYFLKRLGGTMRKIAGSGIVGVSREMVKDTLIKPGTTWFGIIRKDLMIASRLPSYASLFVLPAIQTVILAITLSSRSEMGLSNALGILVGMSFLTLLIPTALFSIEGLASAYMRSLPLRRRTLIFSKTVLSTLTYLISIATLLVVALYLGKAVDLILTFGVAHIISVAAASMLEIVLLTNKYWKEGFSMGNIYARLSTYILILIPGLVVVLMPIVAAFAMYLTAESLVLPVFLAVALAEFIAVTLVTLHEE